MVFTLHGVELDARRLANFGNTRMTPSEVQLLRSRVHFPFGFRSESLLLLSNKAQVIADSFYYEMVYPFLFTALESAQMEKVNLPTEDQSDTINDLKDKCLILIESFSKNQSNDRFTWQDIAQRLILEGKGTTAEMGATKEDFQHLLGEFKNTGECSNHSMGGCLILLQP
ncbi:hypothetical protein VNO80_11702 [Phaseolus coccineus]|uniref:Uncharacterized protein n=1 Tax=Phaseolus coccineus TaxID=3886 RepID=A0AAN9NAP6_PHACN